jgi:hypothetical protein
MPNKKECWNWASDPLLKSWVWQRQLEKRDLEP